MHYSLTQKMKPFGFTLTKYGTDGVRTSLLTQKTPRSVISKLIQWTTMKQYSLVNISRRVFSLILTAP